MHSSLCRTDSSCLRRTIAVKQNERAYKTTDMQVTMVLSWASMMNHSNAQLVKLPDELLLIILKKLANTNVLYSLMGLNLRLDRIIRDPCFTTEINLIKLNDDETSGQVETLIDRFCLDILPTIGHRIRWLKVRSISMERVLLATDYLNLSQLDILISDKEPILHFNGESTVAFSSAGSLVHEHTFTFVRLRAKILSRLTIHARTDRK